MAKTTALRLEVRLNSDDHRAVQKVAKAWQLSVSEVVRRLVRLEARRLEGRDAVDPAKP